ncbi:hypothetical protein [Variovorax paradoxus]|uniref:hypothetical protein n=1 Tax=Variovorax paradoxus TaxID=34073 RepID=UPI0024817282|nr:hypothetical protein [Variovorax paradoxus]WGT65001.1 hypothetical protein QHG62_06565 [Variovorax paradoxus]
MAAHRYWRVKVVAAYAGGALTLSEVQLFNETTRVDAAATLSSNVAPTSGTLANLKDDSLTTEASWAVAKDVVLVWDLGSGGDVDVTNILFGSADSRLVFPAVAVLQWSDDGAAWSDRYPTAFIGIKWPGVRTKTANTMRAIPGQMRFDKDWRDLSIAGETVFSSAPGSHVAVNGYRMQLSTAAVTDSKVRFATMPSMADVDITLVANVQGEPCVVFRTTYWGAANDSYGYVVGLGAGNVYISHGSNNATPVYTTIAATPHGLSGSGDWTLRVSMVGSTYKVYVNGVLKLTGTDTTFAGAGEVGVRTYNSTSYFNWIQVREAEETHSLIELDAAYVRTSELVRVPSAMSIVMPYGSTKAQPFFRARPDYLTGVRGQGVGRVRGVTLDYVNPLNKPYRCRVRLVREADGLVIREQWSAADGSYDFQYVDELQSYTVLAYYLDHGKRAVVTDGLSLANGKVELMP